MNMFWRRIRRHQFFRFGIALALSSAVSVLLFLARWQYTDSLRYWFLLWNLVLAWVPLFAALWLAHRLRSKRWLEFENLLLTAVWLGFLPNSFYLVSDLIHLHSTGEINLLYDTVLFFSCIANGHVTGFLSMLIVQRELSKRQTIARTYSFMGLVILLCSFAIYLGRFLRWNTWDILVNPAGLIFDVSDRIINPVAHPQAFLTTFTFFILTAGLYAVIWEGYRAVRRD